MNPVSPFASQSHATFWPNYNYFSSLSRFMIGFFQNGVHMAFNRTRSSHRMNDTHLDSYGFVSMISVSESGGLCDSDSDYHPSDLEHLTAFGLQVDESEVVTFSYTIKNESDVEGNMNGYICEADGKSRKCSKYPLVRLKLLLL